MEAAAQQPWPTLGSLLVRDGLLSEEQLESALVLQQESGQRLGEILIERGDVTRTQLARLLAEQVEMPLVELEESEIDTDAALLLPEELARRYRALPVGFLPDESLLVAVADPTNVLHWDDLRLALGVPLRFGVAAPDAIDAAIGFVHQQSLDIVAPVEEDGDDASVAAGIVDMRDAEADTPAVTLVNKTIQRALALGASDIHFTPQLRALEIRARVDGVVRKIGSIPISQQASVTSRLKVIGRLDIAERRAPQDGRVAVRTGGHTIDLRIAVLPTKFGEKVTLRVLNQASAPRSLTELALAPATEEAIRRAIHQPFGAVITCGPTGSGKTTTLYAALSELNTPERTLMSIEDPVEYLTPGVDQIEVNPRAGLTFARGLRTILRSDPDVILVGEIRDEETAQIAVRAAMTGHLVCSTLHAQTAASAIRRLTDMGVEPGLLAATSDVPRRPAARASCLPRLPREPPRDAGGTRSARQGLAVQSRRADARPRVRRVRRNGLPGSPGAVRGAGARRGATRAHRGRSLDRRGAPGRDCRRDGAAATGRHPGLSRGHHDARGARPRRRRSGLAAEHHASGSATGPRGPSDCASLMCGFASSRRPCFTSARARP